MKKWVRWKLKQHFKIIWQEAPEAAGEAVIVDLPVEDQEDLPVEAQEVIKPFYEDFFSHPLDFQFLYYVLGVFSNPLETWLLHQIFAIGVWDLRSSP